MRMDFRKRFSVGLPVIDPPEAFDRFLDQYADYIENIYFSLPIGDQFHSRIVTQRVLHATEKIPYFLELLRCVKSHGVHLELLFNTAGLSEADILHAKDFMDQKGIDPDEIGIRKEYYSLVKRLFCGKELVFSFNNFPANRSDFFSHELPFDQYVVGRQFIRDTTLLRQIKEHNAKSVLLLNNGCSFTCGGCSNGNHCHDAYYRERAIHSAEYLYALQSIFPFEIHEGYIDTQLVEYYKIASRNADVAYIRACMDSYIFNDESAAERNPNQYLLWSRLTWHSDSFSSFSLQKMTEMKKEIYRDTAFEKKIRTPEKKLNLELDLTDKYAFRHDPFSDADLENWIDYVSKSLHTPKNRLRLSRVYLGVSSCEILLPLLDTETLCADVRFFAQKRIRVFLTLPPITRHNDAVARILEKLKAAQCAADGFVVNDEATFAVLRQKYDLPIGLGRIFDLKDYTETTAHLSCASDNSERKALFPPGLRAFIERYQIPFIQCDMDDGGMWIAEDEPFGVSVYPQQRITKKNLFCARAAGGDCGGNCAAYSSGNAPEHGKLLTSVIPFTQDVQSMLIENRCAFVLQPPYRTNKT